MGKLDWSYKSVRWGLGAVFIYAGSGKLLEPKAFAVLIEAYGILPDSLLLPAAVALPALELAAGIGLLFDIKASLSIIAALLGLFIAFLSYGIWMGLDVDCGCFGPEDPEGQAFQGLRPSLYRDLVMLAGVFLLYGLRRFYCIEPVKIKEWICKRHRKRRTEDAIE